MGRPQFIDLTLDSFQISNENDITTYSITTNREEAYEGTYTLEIKLYKDSYLDTIIIRCNTDKDGLRNITACADEVEDALSYALYDTRKNDRGIDFIKNELKLKNYIDKNGKILKNNFNVSEYDSKNLKNVRLEIKEDEQVLTIKY